FKFIQLIDLNQLKNFNVQNIITKFGLDDGSRVLIMFSKLMAAKGYSQEITFNEFYKKTKKKFIVTGACINDKKIYYFSHTNYPDMKVFDAVRISMAIPIIYTPHIFE